MSLSERLVSADPVTCLAAIDAVLAQAPLAQAPLAQAPPEAEVLHALARCLGSPHKLIQRRAAQAFATLRGRGVMVRDVLLATLQSPLLQQRWGATYALSLLEAPPRASLPVLIECLGIEDGDVRWAAAQILLRWRGDADAVEALRVLLNSGNAAQRKMAAYCLRDLDARLPAVEQTMLACLDDPDPGVRMAVMSGLARLSIHQADVAQRLIKLLADADPGVRRAAAATLGALGQRLEAVLTALHGAAGSPDPSLQRAAQRSLRLLKS